MLPLTHGDVTTAARRLMFVPMGQRTRVMRVLIARAERAAHAKEWGAHPNWGDGTLGQAARDRVLGREPACDDPDYAHALSVAYGVVWEHVCARGAADFS